MAAYNTSDGIAEHGSHFVAHCVSQKLLLPLLTSLVLLTITLGCDGFFVDPTLTSIAVTPPTPSVLQNETVQMNATGTYNDGTTKNITGTATWSSSDITTATISSSGLVTAISPGSTSITASSQAISGSTTVTITIANLASIQVSPSTTSAITGQTVPFQATGTYQGGGSADITASVVWSANSQGVTISNSPPTNGQATITGPFTRLPLQVTITATSGDVSGTATLVVTQ